MTSFAIDVRKLDYSFGKDEARKQVLFDINLQIKTGSLTVLMGPSGSGKTTLLTLMDAFGQFSPAAFRFWIMNCSGQMNIASCKCVVRLVSFFRRTTCTIV